MQLWFIISVVVAICGLIGAFANVGFGIKDMSKHNYSDPSNIFLRHLIFGLMWSLGAISSIISGIIWLVYYLKG